MASLRKCPASDQLNTDCWSLRESPRSSQYWTSLRSVLFASPAASWELTAAARRLPTNHTSPAQPPRRSGHAAVTARRNTDAQICPYQYNRIQTKSTKKLALFLRSIIPKRQNEQCFNKELEYQTVSIAQSSPRKNE